MMISIIINNFNYASYVGAAIESAISQTYGKVEIICVDDGSSDSSADVISGFANIKKIFKQNGGQTSAIRAGLSAAVGDAVILLDADDILFPDACTKIAEAWSPNTSYVQFKLRLFSDQELDLGCLPRVPFVKNHLEFLLKHGRFPYAPTSGNAFSRHWAAEILNVTQRPDRQFCDMILALCSPMCGNVTSIDECLGGYRVHSDNFSWRLQLRDSYFGSEEVEREIRIFARHMGIHIERNAGLTGPYHYQNGIKLFIKRDPDIGADAARDSALKMIWSFCTFPGLAANVRIKNVLAGILVAISPSIARVIISPFCKWAPSSLPARAVNKWS